MLIIGVEGILKVCACAGSLESRRAKGSIGRSGGRSEEPIPISSSQQCPEDARGVSRSIHLPLLFIHGDDGELLYRVDLSDCSDASHAAESAREEVAEIGLLWFSARSCRREVSSTSLA